MWQWSSAYLTPFAVRTTVNPRSSRRWLRGRRGRGSTTTRHATVGVVTVVAADDHLPQRPAGGAGVVPPAQVVGPGPAHGHHRTATTRERRAPQPAGGADGSPLPDTVTGRRRRRAARRATAGRTPAPATGRAPRPATARRVARRRVDALVTWLAPRHPVHPLRRRPPARRHRGDHRVGPEHPLHPCERAPGTIGGRGVAAPEPELAPDGGHDIVGHEPQQRDPAGDVVDIVDVVGGDRRRHAQ